MHLCICNTLKESQRTKCIFKFKEIKFKNKMCVCVNYIYFYKIYLKYCKILYISYKYCIKTQFLIDYGRDNNNVIL